MFLPRRRLSLAIAAVLVAAIAVAAVVYSRSTAVVALAPVTQGKLERRLIFSGRVAAPIRVELGATLTGRIAEVKVREGDEVASGDLLARIESDEIEAQLSQAEAGLRIAEARLKSQRELARPTSDAALAQAAATLDLANRDARRSQELFDRGFVSQARIDESQRTVKVAAAQLEAARAGALAQGASGAEFTQARLRIDESQAALALARNRLAQTRLRAPADGRIVARHTDIGQIVQPGKPLFVFVASGATQLIGQADEKFLSELAVGQPAQVVVDAFPGRPFGATIRSIAPGVDAQRGTIEVKFLVAGRPDFLREDMTLSLSVTTASKDSTLTVPAAALVGGGDKPRVRLIADGHIAERPVTVGLRTLERVEILSGLAAGDQVLLDPSSVQPGQRARAGRPGEAASSRAAGSGSSSSGSSNGAAAAMGASAGAP